MASWSFLTGHAGVPLRIARDPGARLLDLEASAGITDRSASGPVTGAAEAGYIVKHKDSRRDRYRSRHSRCLAQALLALRALAAWMTTP